MRRVVAAVVFAAATLGALLMVAHSALATPLPVPQPTRSAARVTPSAAPQPTRSAARVTPSAAPQPTRSATPAQTATPSPQPAQTAAPAPATPSAVPQPSQTATPAPEATPAPSRGTLDRLGDAAAGTAADLQCKRPPAPGRPEDGLAGWIDSKASGGGTGYYSRYGYGGWQPVIYDPGCPISADGLRGAEARIFDGRNEIAALYMQIQLAAVALSVEAAQIVFAQDGIWALFTPVTAFLRWDIGNRWWMLFGALAMAATGVFWLLRARRGDVAEASASSARSAIILAVGGACLATTLTAGSAVSQGVSAFYGAMQDATTQSAAAAGGAATAPAAPAATADAVLGDMLMTNVIYPSWTMLHFGNDQQAAAEFGPRLLAASAMTREEAARAAQDPGYASSLAAAKKADYATVASQYQAAYPETYNRNLAGNDTSGRPSAALAGLLACIPIVVFLVWSLWWMGTLRIVIDFALALAPAGALIAQFPRTQWLATSLIRWLTGYFVTAAIATTAFVVLVAGGVGGILGSGAATSSKVIAMFVLLLLGRAVWKRRKVLTERTGTDRDVQRMTAAMEALREEYREARTARTGLTGETGATVGRDPGSGAAAPVVLADADPRRLRAEDPGTEPARLTGAGPAVAAAAGAATAGGLSFDSFDEDVRERAARRVAEARGQGRPPERQQLERPRRLDPLDWPTDKHAPTVSGAPGPGEGSASAAALPPPQRLSEPAAAPREVSTRAAGP